MIDIDDLLDNAFCPTGEGGGVDPSCSPGGSSSGDRFFDQASLLKAEAGGYKSREKLVRMPVDDFLKLAEHLDAPSPSKRETVKDVLASGKEFETLPHLGFTHDGEGNATVVSHEGRHRAMALKELGVTHLPVVLVSQAGGGGDSIRWDSQREGHDRITGKWPSKLQGQSGGYAKFPVGDQRKGATANALVVNPFVSEAQRAWMHAEKPEMAREWEEHTPKGKRLPRKKRVVKNKRAVANSITSIKARRAKVAGRRLAGSRVDPTRTGALQRAITAQMRRRFQILKGRIVKVIDAEDALGLRDPGLPFALNAFCPTGIGGGVDPSCSPGGSGAGGQGVLHTGNVKEALEALRQGRHVELAQPRQVATLIDRIAKMVKQAEALGEKAPVYNLCNVSVAGTNLFCAESKGIERLKMPQLKGIPEKGSAGDRMPKDDKGKVNIADKFVDSLRHAGVGVMATTEDASYLKASQNELDGAKAARMLKRIRRGDDVPSIVISRDNYIVDGHHHWAGQIAHEHETGKPLRIKVERVDMDIIPLLARANKFAASKGLKSEPMTGNALAIEVPFRHVEGTYTLLVNAFCPTGEGGGVDPSCSPGISVKTDDGKSYISTFEVAGKEFFFQADKMGPRDWDVGFGLSSMRGSKGGTARMTHDPTTSPFEVFRGVQAALHTFVRSKNPREIEFTAEHSEPSRVKLYDRLSVEIGQAYGYSVKAKDYMALREFTLTKNRLATNAGRWQFEPDAEKIKAFQRWLKAQLAELLTSKTEEELWAKYAAEGFKKGAGRAFDDVNVAKRVVTDPRTLDFFAGSREEFLRSAFGRPVAVEKVKLLAGRSFDDLDGISSSMSLKMSRALTDGLVQGKGPRDIARDLNEEVDIGRKRAEVIARTEIVRAHAEGQLEALGQLGVEEVGVAVEWSTTGDDKVCEECEPMEGVVLKLDEAAGMIPRHPNCRCAWIPANVGEDDKDQKDDKREISSAIRESLDEEGGESSWAGADADIDRNRPQSILNQLSDFEQLLIIHGGSGSGNFGHAGRPGEIGGSAPAPGGGAGWTGEHGSVGLAAINPAERAALSPAERKEWNKIRAEARGINERGRAGRATMRDRQRAKDIKARLVKLKAKGKAAADPAKLAQWKADVKAKDAAKAEAGRAAAAQPQPPMEVRGVASVERMPAGGIGHPGSETVRLEQTPVATFKEMGRQGINGSYKMTLTDGTVGVWKPRDEEFQGGRRNVPNNTLYKREATTYEVAKAVGMTDMVPPTVIKVVDGRPGSFMKFADNAKNADDAHNPWDGPKDLARLAAFDMLTGNTDRHDRNWMIQTRAGKSDKLIAIDHGYLFPVKESHNFRSYPFNWAHSRGLKIPPEVANWKLADIHKAMDKYKLEPKAKEMVTKRFGLLQEWLARDGKFHSYRG